MFIYFSSLFSVALESELSRLNSMETEFDSKYAKTEQIIMEKDGTVVFRYFKSEILIRCIIEIFYCYKIEPM